MNGFAALDIPPCRRYVVVKATAGFAVCRLILKLLLFYSCLDFTQNLGKTRAIPTPSFSIHVPLLQHTAAGRASVFLHKTLHFARRAPPCAPAAGDCQKNLVDRRGESCYSFVDFERHRLAESFQSNLLGTAQTGLRPYGQPGPLPTGGASCHY